MSNPDAEGAINSINEFTQWVEEHGSIANGMRTDINQNASDIAEEILRAKAAEEAVQGEVDALEGVVATKAAQADLETLEGRVDTAEGDIDALEGRMNTAEADIDALQALFGEGDGTVADMIADAVAVARTAVSPYLTRQEPFAS